MAEEEEEEEEKRNRRIMKEMSKIMKKMSKDMGKLSKVMEEMSKIMREMSQITTTTTGEMSSTTTTTTFPQHIIMEILSWVPAKSLVSSFKFVCKEWRALMLDPHFIKMHINRRGGGGGGGGGGRGLICKSGNVLFQLHPPFNSEAATKLLADFGPLLYSSFRLVGSCNGLICLSINHDQSIILLNPSTRKFKISPIQPIKHLRQLDKLGVTFGLGCCSYNSTNKVDEYKVVRIVGFTARVRFVGFEGHVNDKYSIIAQYDIYSMSSDSWRRESVFRDLYDISFDQIGVFSNGALHWMGWDRIVSFDIRDEEFRQVPIPVSFEPTADDPSFQAQDIILMNMRGCLAMIGSSDVNNKMDVDLEVWVMKEYGMKESWTKEFVIRSSDSDPPRALSEFSMSSSSTAYVLKGDQILIEGSPSEKGYRKLVLYDINEGKIDGNFKMIGVPDEPNMFQFDYIETLVSLKSLLLPLSSN